MANVGTIQAAKCKQIGPRLRDFVLENVVHSLCLLLLFDCWTIVHEVINDLVTQSTACADFVRNERIAKSLFVTSY